MPEYAQPYHIICEGKSEVAYIQELKRYIRDNEIPIEFALIAHNAGSGEYEQLKEEFDNVKERNPRDTYFAIWCDADIYTGNRNANDIKNQNAYREKPDGVPDFMFNHQNFEDFLVMHLADDLFNKWESQCLLQKHFKKPLFANDNAGRPGYVNLLNRNNIFGCMYQKGVMPNTFVISSKTLRKMYTRHNDAKCNFKSDFADFLQNLLQEDHNN